ncbi:glycosyltransferase family 2 protein [Azonexus sp.]|jgi:glycosyltransferase involved in cell wall biosynthesis|uniref:glycosyltransferase family 2 protein n=1 Tax=Azonexus sp. TaxID=1872668 RepID=UPI002819F520|nr:glycosyltransferase family 2 protein [Azonexus sp.]MDR1995091.1 glycosyltransferase [Azonexus sp.]
MTFPTKPVRLTVALPTYNRASTYLPEAINAILAQTYQDFELLVLDNGSVDGTAQFVLGLNDPRIRYVRNPPGMSIQFNHTAAYQIALGQRIIVTHDDDVMAPEMLEKQMRFMDEHPEVKLVWTNVSHMNEHGEMLDTPPASGSRLFGPGEYILDFARERLWPMPSTVMMEKGLVQRGVIDQYYYGTKVARCKASDADIAGLADVTFPAYVNIRAAIGLIDKPLLKYRIHTGQGSNRTNISVPSIYLYRRLKKFACRSLKNQSAAPLFDSHVLRFVIQDKVCSSEKMLAPRALRSIQYKVSKFCQNTLTPDAVYPLLPVHILLKILGMASALDAVVPSLPMPMQHAPAMKYLHKWLQSVMAGRSIFAGIAKEKRIVITGSVFIAALLILEARAHGYHIVACIDSNLNRQGRKLLDVPIHAPGWLATHANAVDWVIFSSEKDQEPALRAMVRQHAGTPIPTVSWKDLASEQADQLEQSRGFQPRMVLR